MCKSKMGRPKKLEAERTHINVYLDDGVLKSVDDYIFRVKQNNRGYSRSDFFNETAVEFFQNLQNLKA